MPESLLRLMVQFDTELDLAEGQGIAQTLCEGVLSDFRQGDYGYLVEGWNLSEDPAPIIERILAQATA